MAFTLICHVCGHKLKLFDSSIKKRKGMIRCPHCSARISYDLDSRKIEKSGFWQRKNRHLIIEQKIRCSANSNGIRIVKIPPCHRNRSPSA